MTLSNNNYAPHLMRVAALHDETSDVRTLRLEFIDNNAATKFGWRAGQFGEFSVFGSGECVFTIANSPNGSPHIECTFRQIGKVTSALRSLSIGQTMGFRGPYGNYFPVDDWRARNLFFVGGGIGMAALRAPLKFVLDHRADFGEIVILNGAKTVGDMVYKEEMKQWEQIDGVKVVRTVDPGGGAPDWQGEVGLIPNVFEKLNAKPDGRIVIVCGPPVMLNFMFAALDRLGYSQDQVITTLENKMKCALGHCGRCNVGRYYICRDGPVFSWAQLKDLPKDL